MKMRVFWTVLFLLAVLWSGCGKDGKKTIPSSVAYQLPEDHRLHQGAKYQNDNDMEWLYFTGKLSDSKGNNYGYEVNIFQVWMDEIQDFAYKTDIAITDVSNDRFHVSSLFSFASGTLRFDPEKKENLWEYMDEGITIRHWESSDIWELKTNNGKSGDAYFGIDLILQNSIQDYYPETPNGVIKMGRCEGGNIENMLGLSYYYTHPDLKTEGTFEIAERLISVSGDTWFDHQWGNFNKCPANWDWFSLRLDSGDKLMLFQFNERDNPEDPVESLLALAYFPADGDPAYRSGKDAFKAIPLRKYRSKVNGKVFRVDWKLETPYGNYFIRPYIDEQVVPDGNDSYYEGLVKVYRDTEDGPIIGSGYLETTIVGG